MLGHGGICLELNYKTENETNYVIANMNVENSLSMHNNIISICGSCIVVIWLKNQYSADDKQFYIARKCVGSVMLEIE